MQPLNRAVALSIGHKCSNGSTILPQGRAARASYAATGGPLARRPAANFCKRFDLLLIRCSIIMESTCHRRSVIVDNTPAKTRLTSRCPVIHMVDHTGSTLTANAPVDAFAVRLRRRQRHWISLVFRIRRREVTSANVYRRSSNPTAWNVERHPKNLNRADAETANDRNAMVQFRTSRMAHINHRLSLKSTMAQLGPVSNNRSRIRSRTGCEQ
jgi:hypothetical protein